MSQQIKLKLLFSSSLILFGIFIPFFVETIIIKRILQFCVFSVLTFLFFSILRDKTQKKEKVNYWGLVLVIVYGLALYFMLKFR